MYIVHLTYYYQNKNWVALDAFRLYSLANCFVVEFTGTGKSFILCGGNAIYLLTYKHESKNFFVIT